MADPDLKIVVKPMPIIAGWCVRTIVIALATMIVAGCGPCGNVKRIGLVGEQQDQIDHDRAMLQRYWNRSNYGFAIRIDLEDMAKHRETADALVHLGYLRRAGSTYAYTSKSRAESVSIDRSHYWIPLETIERRALPPFTAAYETVACDETHSFNRVYSFDEYLGPLTQFGKALLEHKLLYYGHDDALEALDGKPGFNARLWPGRQQPIYHLWYFDPPSDDDPGQVLGESLGFKWEPILR